ncbi:MAG TPA: VWA domain-containing protein, partial [Gemmataceae bacterium]|nr:VWA domain-containing protein [Gemmataceae bacterium]
MTHLPKQLGGLLFAAGLFAAVAAVPAADPPREEGKTIDVVLCLDTSNSMDGLIASAKTKLWAIVNDLIKVKPTPNLRVGLYSYGNDTYDRNVGWVRKEVDLTTDLDKISEKLFGLTTKGGTEYVSRVCRDALNEQKWSDDKGALKLIFVCGNEPASQDPEVTLKAVADKAAAKGVIINPIFCGPENHRDAVDWKQFASLAGGRFASINQDGTVAIQTPMDKELADLSAKL